MFPTTISAARRRINPKGIQNNVWMESPRLGYQASLRCTEFCWQSGHRWQYKIPWQQKYIVISPLAELTTYILDRNEWGSRKGSGTPLLKFAPWWMLAIGKRGSPVLHFKFGWNSTAEAGDWVAPWLDTYPWFLDSKTHSCAWIIY